MKAVFTFIRMCILCACIVSFQSGSAQNLIINFSIESALVSKWNVLYISTNCAADTYTWQITGTQSEYPSPQNGSYYFTPGCRNTNDALGAVYEIYQDVQVGQKNRICVHKNENISLAIL